MTERFRDRRAAGRRLAEELRGYAGRGDVVVLGLPRGGVPVAYEVAERLHAPLDVFLVRKLGVPGHEELAMGAIASGGIVVANEDLIAQLDVSRAAFERAVERETRELERRELAYRGGRARPELRGRVAIVVDDGLATGATMRAAVEALRRLEPARIVVAVPTAAGETRRDFERIVDEVACASTPHPFQAVGLWYEDFTPTTDEEVRELLERSRSGSAGPR
jgi:predicted phosphoribosyltransferase